MMNLNLSNQTLLYIIIGLFILQFVVMRYYVNSTIEQEKHTNNKKIIKQLTEQINSPFDKYADKSRDYPRDPVDNETKNHIPRIYSHNGNDGGNDRNIGNKYKYRQSMNDTENDMCPDTMMNKSRTIHKSSKRENEYKRNINQDIDSIEDPADNEGEQEQEQEQQEEQNQGSVEEQEQEQELDDNELSEA